MPEFTFCWEISARLEAPDSGNTLAEAYEHAEQTYDSADFGDASGIEGEIRCILDEDGGELWNSDMATPLEVFIKQYDEDAWGKRDLADLGLSARAYDCLRRAGMSEVLDLLVKSRTELLQIHALGQSVADEIEAKLAEYNLHLREE